MIGDHDLEQRVRRLEDLEQLRRLKADYFASVDQREWDRFRSLFAEDCTFTSSTRLPSLGGPDDFVALVRSMVEPGRSTHVGFMPRFEFIDEDQAAARWSMFDFVERDEPGRPGWMGLGTYTEQYRRHEDGWLITSWRLDRGPTRPIRQRSD